MSDAETPLPQPLLEDEALDLLDDFLEESAGPDALDLIGAHGFLVALAVAPREVPASAWVAELFHGTPEFQDEQERETVLGLLEQLKSNAIDVLEGGGLPELPFELTLDGIAPEETPIGDWCAGFMEGVFLDEVAWFEGDEESVATLLLPFMALSGIFADEPDMADLSSDTARLESLVAQLPELVLDLYLHFRVPPDTPKPKPRPKRPSGKKGHSHKGKQSSKGKKR